MSCSLSEALPWSALLEARQILATGCTGLAFVYDGSWHCQASSDTSWQTADAALLVGEHGANVSQAAIGNPSVSLYITNARGLPHIETPAGTSLDPALATAARVYLPVLLGAAKAKRDGKSFIAGHLTQTLDGRIACENGQSQWIGNEADLHHSHRMRALLDGVMVGATTALHDNPRLTVRHVDGPNPRRVVLSGRGRVLDAMDSLQLMQSPGCELLTHTSPATMVPDPTVHVHELAAEAGRLQPQAVLAKLRERGIHSLYLEGGSGTLSSFLEAGCVDLLQVHIAALVLGSGLPSLQLQPVDHVSKGMKLHMDHAILDGHVLLTCRPQESL